METVPEATGGYFGFSAVASVALPASPASPSSWAAGPGQTRDIVGWKSTRVITHGDKEKKPEKDRTPRRTCALPLGRRGRRAGGRRRARGLQPVGACRRHGGDGSGALEEGARPRNGGGRKIVGVHAAAIDGFKARVERRQAGGDVVVCGVRPEPKLQRADACSDGRLGASGGGGHADGWRAPRTHVDGGRAVVQTKRVAKLPGGHVSPVVVGELRAQEKEG